MHERHEFVTTALNKAAPRGMNYEALLHTTRQRNLKLPVKGLNGGAGGRENERGRRRQQMMLSTATLLFLPNAPSCPTTRHPTQRAHVRSDLGLQVDPAASASSIFAVSSAWSTPTLPEDYLATASAPQITQPNDLRRHQIDRDCPPFADRKLHVAPAQNPVRYRRARTTRRRLGNPAKGRSSAACGENHASGRGTLAAAGRRSGRRLRECAAHHCARQPVGPRMQDQRHLFAFVSSPCSPVRGSSHACEKATRS